MVYGTSADDEGNDYLMGPSDDERQEEATGPFFRGAPAYEAKGHHGVIPLVKSDKLPAKAGITGRKGVQTKPKHYTAPKTMARYAECNLGLRLEGMVGIDVDDYVSGAETKTGAADLAELESILGPLPTGPSSTARGDGPSRIRIFNLPDDFEVTEELRGSLTPSIEIVQRHHRLVCAWPSIHPKTGATYRWYDADGNVMPDGEVPAPEDFPVLPDKWLEHLRKPQREHRPGAGLGVEEFRAEYTQETDPDLVAHILNRFDARDGNRHDTMWKALCWAAREATYGKVHAGHVFDKLAPLWDAATKGEGREHEFDKMVEDSVKDTPEPEDFADDLYVDPDAKPDRPFAVDGLSFLAPEEEDEPPLWGNVDRAALWNSGESLFIFGPPGAGKSTLTHLIVFARLGLMSDVLGFPVTDDGRKVLYLAMDRPKQIQRAMRRLVRPEHHEVLARRLLVHRGPLDFTLTDAKNRDVLRDMCDKDNIGTVVVDSIKDVLPDASKEDSAGVYNTARQSCLAAGIEWIELHHNRKANGQNKEPNTLEDVYGSRWLTAGAGSVISLWQDDPTSNLVSLRHIRAAGEKLRDLTLTLTPKTGMLSYQMDRTMAQFLKEQDGEKFTAKMAADYIRKDVHGVRTTLNRMVKAGELVKVQANDDEDPFDDGSKSGYQAPAS